MRNFSMICAVLIAFAASAAAQLPTARVQVLHNSPTPTIDVYVNGIKTFDDFEFRKATPYMDLPAGIPLSVGIAPSNSQSAADILETFPLQFEAGRTYFVTANGVIFNADTPLGLVVDEYGRETAFTSGRVAVSFLHGSPGAPLVDISIRTGNKIVSNLSYGQYTGYLDLPNQDYFVDIKTAGTNNIIATYRVDLTPHAGKAIKIFTSGFIGNDPPFGLYGAFANGDVVAFPLGPVCRVQVINNSPSATLDFFKNGNKIYDDIAFRTAKPYAFVPADLFFNIGVGPSTTASVADTFYNTTFTFQNGKDYIITLDGIVGNAANPFKIHINEDAREFVNDTSKVEVAFFHGAPGAPAVDADALFYANDVVKNLSYGQHTAYQSLTPDKYDFAIRPTGSSTVVASYRADLSGLKGKTAYVFASGLFTSNPAFGLFAALANGTIIALPITPLSSVQLIHNAPPPTVDIYAGNSLLLNDFAFRTATPFLEIPADRNINIGVAASTSQSAAESIANFPVNFSSSKKYVVYATGVVGNPDHPFTLIVNDKAISNTAPGFVAFNVMHGIPDISDLDIAGRFEGDLVQDLSYGEFSNPYTQLPPDDYYLDVKPAGINQIIQTYAAPFSGLNGQVLQIFASGYFDGSPSYGLFAAKADGTVIELLPARIARVQIIHNSPSPTVDVYAFDELVLDDFEFRDATNFFTVPAEVPIPFVIAPGNSQSAADGIDTIPVTFENNKTYILVASGIVGDAITPFAFIKKEGAREEALDLSSVELTFLHGAPGAPAVDLNSFFDNSPVLKNLAYGNFSDYIPFDPTTLILDVETNAAPHTLVGTYGGDFTGADGIAAVVFASGLLNGDPALELWMALSDGTTFPLPAFARAQMIHNSPEPEVDAYYVDAFTTADGVQILDNFSFRSATGWGLFPAGSPFSVAVAPPNSNSATDALFSKELNFTTGKAYTMMLGGVVGNSSTPFDIFVSDKARYRPQTPSNVEINLVHGSTDAPEVDLTSQTGTVLFDNIQYGEYADYLSVPPASYLVRLTPADNNNQTVRTYIAHLDAYGGQALTAFASGYLSAGQNPEFQIWVATGTGETFPLDLVTAVQESESILGNLQIAPNPATDQLTMKLEQEKSKDLQYRILDLNGRLLQETQLGAQSGKITEKINVSTLSQGLYLLEVRAADSVKTVKFSVQR